MSHRKTEYVSKDISVVDTTLGNSKNYQINVVVLSIKQFRENQINQN